MSCEVAQTPGAGHLPFQVVDERQAAKVSCEFEHIVIDTAARPVRSELSGSIACRHGGRLPAHRPRLHPARADHGSLDTPHHQAPLRGRRGRGPRVKEIMKGMENLEKGAYLLVPPVSHPPAPKPRRRIGFVPWD